MKKVKKISLTRMRSLTKSEMKMIMAGSGDSCGTHDTCTSDADPHCPSASGCKCDTSRKCVKA